MSGADQHADWLTGIIDIAELAGAAILDIYRRDFDVEFKHDDSPLTAADMAAHRAIAQGLAELTPDVPVLSEEGAHLPWDRRRQWQRYWLVDPLDGTREFVKRNGEFTVNIALVEDGFPILGVVHAPVTGLMAWARKGEGAWRRDAATGAAQRIEVAPRSTPPWRVVGSRSHRDGRLAAFLESRGPVAMMPMGSSLKFIAIACGDADLYLRHGPTSEWDTAAGQCVLEAAGGAVVALDGAPLRCNQGESLLNPSFLACAGDPKQWLSTT